MKNDDKYDKRMIMESLKAWEILEGAGLNSSKGQVTPSQERYVNNNTASRFGMSKRESHLQCTEDADNVTSRGCAEKQRKLELLSNVH